MNKVIKKTKVAADLREKAERKYILDNDPDRVINLSIGDIQRLIQDLEVHQIELEMQNEELRLIEEKATESSDKFTELYDFAPVGYFTLDSEGIISGLNLNAAKMLGKGRAALVNSNFKLFITQDTLKSFDTFLKVVFESGKKETCEVKLSNDKNKYSYVQIEGIAAKDTQKCLLGAVDISEQKQAGETLRESEESFINMFEQAPLGYQSLDEEGRFLLVNEAWIETLGYSREEVIGKWFGDFLAEEYVQAFRERFPLFKAQGIIHSEFQMIHKNGERRFVAFEGRIGHTTEGLFKQTHCILQDITERKQADMLIEKQTKELKELNAAKDKFFNIIAHDLRSPFTSITGFSSLLLEKMKEKDFEGIEEFVLLVQTSSNRAFNLLSNLLDWAGSQTGKMEYNPDYIDLNELINEAIEISNDTANQKSISINKQLPVKALLSVDKAMISTVLRNLLSNAIKFTNEGGEVLISGELTNNEFVVMVSDNGVGIEQADLENLFRIDTKHITEGTSKERGTGLGLILCKEFVGKHGGKIWVESEAGKGSKFKFSLPAAK